MRKPWLEADSGHIHLPVRERPHIAQEERETFTARKLNPELGILGELTRSLKPWARNVAEGRPDAPLIFATEPNFTGHGDQRVRVVDMRGTLPVRRTRR